MMRTCEIPFIASARAPLAALIAVVALSLLSGPSAASDTAAQQTFASPDEAAQMFVAALKAGDKKAMLSILGPEAGDLVDSGDAVADRASWDKFVTAYEAAHTFVKQDDRTVLEVGTERWPSPIPLVEHDGRWHFDTPAGEQEIIDRRIGRNELAVMQVLLAYVDAQRDYQEANPQKAKIAPYAQRVASSPGKRDGLYWPTKAGEPQSPLGPLIATARAEGYAKAGKQGGIPYHGYYYRVLTAQGPDAKGGAYDYMVRGQMIGGFALIAYPADYDNSGVMTFMVNHDGVIYERDLGPDSARLAKGIKSFNPDATWKEVSPPAFDDDTD